MDHRQGIRINASFPVSVIDYRGEHHSAVTANLGRSGFFCCLSTGTFRVNQPVRLEFTVPGVSRDKAGRAILRALVVRLEDNGLALEFDTMTSQEAQAVNQLRGWLSHQPRRNSTTHAVSRHESA